MLMALVSIFNVALLTATFATTAELNATEVTPPTPQCVHRAL